jgi:serine/threonine-protein kinase
LSKPKSATPTTLTGLGPPLLAGRYQLGSRLGRGAVGQVFEGIDMRDGRTVAIKLIPLPGEAEAQTRQEWLRRLHREAAVSERLQHPDIIAVLDAGLEGPHGWLVMERVNGVDLQRYTPRHRLLPEALVLRIGVRLAMALQHAHRQGVVHRDLKPANVLVDLGQGRLKVADFGIAGAAGHDITRTGLTLGTPAYMAPEVLAGASADAASDTYALGVVLFELLCGQRPHMADTLGELLRLQSQHPGTALATLRADLPPAVLAQLQQLLAPRPADRPADLAAWAGTTASMAQALAKVLSPGVRLTL